MTNQPNKPEVKPMNPNDIEHAQLEHEVLEWTYTARTGLSSEAIAYTTTTGTPQNPRHHPHDPDDLRRCLLLLERIPAAAKALPILAEASPHWGVLVEHWDALDKSLRAEWGQDLQDPEHQPAVNTYAAMRELLAPVEEAKWEKRQQAEQQVSS